MEEKILKKLKEEELKILKEVDRVCKENNIEYFIMYGTLLGAVRHKGFIPWDDDIDICMLRSDYEKFLKIADEKLNQDYFLDNEKNNKIYYLPFAKIRKKNSLVLESNIQNYKGNKGIWLDIFPLEYIKNNEVTNKLKLKVKIINTLNNVLTKKSLEIESCSKITLLSKILPYKFIYLIMDILRKHKSEEKYVIYYGEEGINETQIYAIKDIFPLKKYKFEQEEFYGPKDDKKILTQIYGKKYMELPPEEKRRTHNILKVEFDNK